MNRDEKAAILRYAARLVRAVCAPTPDDIAEPVRAIALEMRDFADNPDGEAAALVDDLLEVLSPESVVEFLAEDTPRGRDVLRRAREFSRRRAASTLQTEQP